ncbi:DsbA family protein [Acaryochloris marina NIES-2412]|uniref:DsbA family protein n=1 Tax=Acaryochloris marina TaxID=155978 RepID=UPI00405A31DE
MPPPLRPCDHFQGSLDEVVTLIIYGDYQCSQSSQAYRTVNNILNTSTHPFCLVYRHFPRTPPHTPAWKAAEAAEAASAQGKFWEMHDLLYQHSASLEDDKLVEYAVEIGLHIPHFLKGLTSHTHTAQVQADVDSGIANAVKTPPTVLISIRYQKSQSLEPLLSKVKEIAALTQSKDSS